MEPMKRILRHHCSQLSQPVMYCFMLSGLERDKFDNKTVSFEEHIKLEHNIWNYLYFIVLVREKNKTDYTGPESYVAMMIKVQEIFITPLRQQLHS